jgi:hypothetical protein
MNKTLLQTLTTKCQLLQSTAFEQIIPKNGELRSMWTTWTCLCTISKSASTEQEDPREVPSDKPAYKLKF